MQVLTWRELVQRAGGQPQARRLVHDGDWVRVVRDAFVPRDVEVDARCRVAALRRVLPSDVAVGGRTALWLLGLDVLHERVEVVVPRGRHLAPRPGVQARSALLPDHELTEVGGLLVVSAARAVVDVARDEPREEAAVVGDLALRAGLTTPALLVAAVHGARGLRGVERARAVLPVLDGRSESPMETRLRLRLVAGGLSGIDVQHDLYGDAGHVGRVDLYVEGVGVEYDGRLARLDRAVFVQERRRQTAIAELGLELRRYTAADVYGRSPRDLAAEVWRAQALAQGRARRVLAGPDTLRRPRLRPLPTLAERARAA